jgi:ABC-type phosphate transport system substrate-binding protein
MKPSRLWFLVGLLAAGDMAGAVDLVVHPRVPVNEISRVHARAIFAARVTRWEDGSPIRVFVLPDDAPLHQDMAKTLLDIYPYQLRSAWDRVTYTGIGLAPIEVGTESEMRRRVSSTPGAIGYLGKVQNHDGLRALLLR